MLKVQDIHSLDQLKSVHILGISGTLMGAFATFLKRKGIHVTGSDQQSYPPISDILQKSQIPVFIGYDKDRFKALDPKPDLVIIGNVIRSNNQEACAAFEAGLNVTSLPAALKSFILSKTQNIVVAGTHGKTTTSSLLTYVLTQCQKNIHYFIGGVTHDLPYSFHLSDEPCDPPLFVLEGDEYDTSFWDKVPKFFHYLPKHVILSSIEYDHADIYPDLPAVVKAFEGLLSRIQPRGHLIACQDYPEVQKLIASYPLDQTISILTYGFHEEAYFQLKNLQINQNYTSFDLFQNGVLLDQHIQVKLGGAHNALNAAAVWIEAKMLHLDLQTVRQAFKSFRGVKRRQEIKDQIRGITVMDDFAHHPSAVQCTLRALRAQYEGKRILCVFEPRSATSRLNVFQEAYQEAFKESDWVLIALPYQLSGLEESKRFSSQKLVDDLKLKNKEAYLMYSVEEGVAQVVQEARSGDLVVIFSNGAFGDFIPKLLESLKA